MSTDADGYAERTLTWSGINATLWALEGETVTLRTAGSGDSRVSVAGALRLVELPLPRCLRFAVAQAVVTLYEADLVVARLRTLDDGHFTVSLHWAAVPWLISDRDLLAVDY